MQYLKEVTDWNMPSHTYIVDDRGWLVGYIREYADEILWFKTPKKSWSKSRRKFKNVTKVFENVS